MYLVGLSNLLEHKKWNLNRLGKTKKQKTKKSVFEEDLEEAWFDGDFVDYVVIFISYCGTC